MKHPTLIIALAFTATACSSTGAPVGSGTEPSNAAEEIRQAASTQTLSRVFDTLDCTDEGHLESAEIAEHMAQLFRPFDRDRNARLSLSEFSRAVHIDDNRLLNPTFAEADRNSDGAVSSVEFGRLLEGMLDLKDADGDGEVTPAEIGNLSLGRYPAGAK